MKKPTDPILFARMPAKEIDNLKNKCKKGDITMSQLIRKLLRLWYKKGEKIFEDFV